MTEPCGFKFDSGNRCGAIETHVVHRGRWSGPEPNHTYTPVPLSRDDSIRAEATAAAEQRLRERIEALPGFTPGTRVAENGAVESGLSPSPFGDAADWLQRGVVLGLLDTPPSASPRQGEPVDGLDAAWRETEAALIAAQGDDDGFGVEIAYWSEFPHAPWAVAANGVQAEAPRLPEALRKLAAALSEPAEP